MKQVKHSISTYDGDFFDFENPQDYKYDITTIAHALSNICRYTGHCNRFYSVAEHSVIVSYLVSPELALDGLLHDASEAFCGDVASPLKAMLPRYKEIEHAVQQSIAKYYGLSWPMSAAIHKADKELYKAERLALTNVDDNIWHTEIEARGGERIKGLLPKEAENLFLNRYWELHGCLKDVA